jgi:O-antigen/teichoic acid export membrane protein
LWWETVYNSQALLAFLVLSSVDIILARRALSLHDAGLYAAGLILVKAVMFLPQFVVILAFPSMGAGLAARRALLGSLALVAASGLAVTLGVQLLPHLALTFVGGTSYNAVGGRLWIFAVLGTVLSMLQLLVYSVLAQQARTAVLWIWAGLVALLAAGLTSHTVLEMATRVLSVDAVVLLVLLLLGLRSLGVRQLAGPSDLASSPRG